MEESPKQCITLCPSAQPDWPESVLIGVVGGTVDAPRVANLMQPQPADTVLAKLTIPVTPTEVFRFAAPCLCTGCRHFDNQVCHLVERVVSELPAVTTELPTCAIRPHCRWWQQEGRAACLRCPQVVTDNYHPSEQMRSVAAPEVDATPMAFSEHKQR